MPIPIIVKLIREDYYEILAADPFPIALERTLTEWWARGSAQKLLGTEDHPIYAESKVGQLRIEG